MLFQRQAKNYATAAIPSLRDLINQVQTARYEHYKMDVAFMQWFISKVESGAHFASPDGGKILDVELAGLDGETLHLPFPITTIEYFMPRGKDENFQGKHNIYCPRRLVLAIETTRNKLYNELRFLDHPDFSIMDSPSDMPVIAIFFAIEYNGTWRTGSIGWLLDPTRWRKTENDFLITPLREKTGKGIEISGNYLISMPGVFHKTVQRYGFKEAVQMCAHDVADEVIAALELMEALVCRNITYEVLSKPSDKVNNARKRNHKTPFFTIHTLKVFDQKTKSAEKSENSNFSEKNARQKPCEHLRRGHIHTTTGKNPQKKWFPAVVVNPGIGQRGNKITRVKKE